MRTEPQQAAPKSSLDKYVEARKRKQLEQLKQQRFQRLPKSTQRFPAEDENRAKAARQAINILLDDNEKKDTTASHAKDDEEEEDVVESSEKPGNEEKILAMQREILSRQQQWLSKSSEKTDRQTEQPTRSQHSKHSPERGQRPRREDDHHARGPREDKHRGTPLHQVMNAVRYQEEGISKRPWDAKKGFRESGDENTSRNVPQRDNRAEQEKLDGILNNIASLDKDAILAQAERRKEERNKQRRGGKDVAKDSQRFTTHTGVSNKDNTRESDLRQSKREGLVKEEEEGAIRPKQSGNLIEEEEEVEEEGKAEEQGKVEKEEEEEDPLQKKLRKLASKKLDPKTIQKKLKEREKQEKEKERESGADEPIVTITQTGDAATAGSANSNKGMQYQSSKVMYDGKSFRVKQVTYIDSRNRTKNYEVIEQVMQSQGAGVIAVPILEKETGEAFLVAIKQWRPAFGTYCVEFPAGSIREDETIERAALRELEEETGYRGRITRVTDTIGVSSGLSNEKGNLVVIKIDEAKQQELNPKQHLGDFDGGSVVKVPLKPSELQKFLTDYQQKNKDHVIDLRVQLVATSLDLLSNGVGYQPSSRRGGGGVGGGRDGNKNGKERNSYKKFDRNRK